MCPQSLCPLFLPSSGRLLHGDLPQVLVQYRDLTVEVDAAVGVGETPTLWNALVGAITFFLPQSRRHPLRVLDGINGALVPVRVAGCLVHCRVRVCVGGVLSISSVPRAALRGR